MILLFDLGATKTRFALAQKGSFGQVERIDTDSGAGGLARWLGAMKTAVGNQRLHAVVGGMPGELEGKDGHLTLSPNLPHWLGLPVLLRMRQVFDCPVYVYNDLVMGGLGEACDGAGSKEGVMVYFTVSTGVNAVRLVNGRVDESIKRYEIGFELVGSEKGGVSSLESLIGGAATQRRYGRPPANIRDARIWRSAERNLAHGVYNTILHWTPDVVVFGGSMMRDIELAGVERELDKLPKLLTHRPNLVKAKLGDLAGLYGALRSSEQHHRL